MQLFQTGLCYMSALLLVSQLRCVTVGSWIYMVTRTNVYYWIPIESLSQNLLQPRSMFTLTSNGTDSSGTYIYIFFFHQPLPFLIFYFHMKFKCLYLVSTFLMYLEYFWKIISEIQQLNIYIFF